MRIAEISEKNRNILRKKIAKVKTNEDISKILIRTDEDGVSIAYDHELGNLVFKKLNLKDIDFLNELLKKYESSSSFYQFVAENLPISDYPLLKSRRHDFNRILAQQKLKQKYGVNFVAIVMKRSDANHFGDRRINSPELEIIDLILQNIFSEKFIFSNAMDNTIENIYNEYILIKTL